MTINNTERLYPELNGMFFDGKLLNKTEGHKELYQNKVLVSAHPTLTITLEIYTAEIKLYHNSVCVDENRAAFNDSYGERSAKEAAISLAEDIVKDYRITDKSTLEVRVIESKFIKTYILEGWPAQEAKDKNYIPSLTTRGWSLIEGSNPVWTRKVWSSLKSTRKTK